MQVAELHPNCAGRQNCRNCMCSARAVMRCPFQPTNRAVWKMEGARGVRILVVVSRLVRWLRPASCNGDFAIAIVRMHVDHNGPRDVTATPANVSDRHHRSNVRGVVCPRWQNALQHRQCSAVHSRVNPLHPVQRNFVDLTSKRLGTCVATQRSQTSVLTCPK